MKFFAALLLALSLYTVSFAQQKQDRFFELRIYYCNPGKLDVLIERFTNHTTKLFEKHGMTNIGYWVPENNTGNALYYILAYPDRKSRDASWEAFSADPEWVKVRTDSEKNGKIIDKIESIFMNPLQFSGIR